MVPRRVTVISSRTDAGISEVRTADARTFEIVAAELRFLERPEPGAHAVLAVTVKNGSGAESPPVELSVAADWFDQAEIVGASPAVLDDRVEDDGRRHFDFPGLDPGAVATLELHVVMASDDVRPPTIHLALQGGESLGEREPELAGVPPRAGPARALSVPRLGIRTGVVDTAWEPPPFVAGQIRSTAALGEGNAVLVGHRQGHAGDVFARLVGARLGDEVVATASGVQRSYVVSMIRTLPGDDVTPIAATETDRLTLMTCTGAWNPITGEYSHRLWVIAEPTDLARATLTAAIARAGEVAATSASPVEAAQARTDAALARVALGIIDARRARRP